MMMHNHFLLLLQAAITRYGNQFFIGQLVFDCCHNKITTMATDQDFSGLLATLRHSFYATHKTKPYEFRLQQLRQLLKLYEENNDLILYSLKKDMNKSKLEGYLYEVDLMQNDARQAIKNLKCWMGEEKLKKNILMPFDCAGIVKEPVGVVLILAPWNYPFQLALVPLCGAIAAGNCVILKPSEISSHSAQTIAKLIPRYLDNSCYAVVTGGPETASKLLDEKFDHIFYTGSFSVAREIHRKANRHLTSCTFELGGKSPVYLDSTANITMAAERIMWGKCMNMGQTCVAPDYLLCTAAVETEFILAAKKAMKKWYGDDWKKTPDLARIINLKHFNRVKGLLSGGGAVAMGGGWDEAELWIEPSIVVNTPPHTPLMTDEIFGPILAIHRITTETEAINFINSLPAKPLCLYVFSDSVATQRRFKLETQSGTMAINDTIVQFAVDELPFGGIGESGSGYYHGKYSFDAFTHLKSVATRDFSWVGDQVGIFRYPPYHAGKIKFLSFLLCHWKKFKFIYFDYLSECLAFFVGFAVCWWVYFRE